MRGSEILERGEKKDTKKKKEKTREEKEKEEKRKRKLNLRSIILKENKDLLYSKDLNHHNIPLRA